MAAFASGPVPPYSGSGYVYVLNKLSPYLGKH